jgi:hypothetical protein
MIPVKIILYNCYTMHNSTHSVHKRLWKVWRVCLLRLWPSCYVSSPPLSEANCQPFPLLAGRAPRLPRWLPFPQDPHTPPSTPSVTISLWSECLMWQKFILSIHGHLKQNHFHGWKTSPNHFEQTAYIIYPFIFGNSFRRFLSTNMVIFWAKRPRYVLNYRFDRHLPGGADRSNWHLWCPQMCGVWPPPLPGPLTGYLPLVMPAQS